MITSYVESQIFTRGTPSILHCTYWNEWSHKRTDNNDASNVRRPPWSRQTSLTEVSFNHMWELQSGWLLYMATVQGTHTLGQSLPEGIFIVLHLVVHISVMEVDVWKTNHFWHRWSIRVFVEGVTHMSLCESGKNTGSFALVVLQLHDVFYDALLNRWTSMSVNRQISSFSHRLAVILTSRGTVFLRHAAPEPQQTSHNRHRLRTTCHGRDYQNDLAAPSHKYDLKGFSSCNHCLY